jgi:hypothetical protein
MLILLDKEVKKVSILPKLNFSSKTINAGSNAKTVKGDKEYLTAIKYLAPYTLSGCNLCAMADIAKCHEGCLNTAGRGSFSNVVNARLKKSKWYNDHKRDFMQALDRDITRFVEFCTKHKVKPAIRLNGTSDIRWELNDLDGETLFDKHPTVQFYDYTKIYNRKIDGIKNYHLTWSYSEANKKYAEFYTTALSKGMNVAVVFRDKNNIPATYKGLNVVDGDKDDLRFLDPKGVIISLYAKGKAKKDTSGFVIDP